MDRFARTALFGAFFLASVTSDAAETSTYTYDALGRLTGLQLSGGPTNGAQVTYAYDAAGNRSQYIVSGSTGSGSITVTPKGSVANVTSVGVVLAVQIAGSSSPTGTVTFTENGVFIGSTTVYAGEASIILEGFSLGTHTITASYSGDSNNAPYSYTFTIKVQNLSWLPGVLEILLSN